MCVHHVFQCVKTNNNDLSYIYLKVIYIITGEVSQLQNQDTEMGVSSMAKVSSKSKVPSKSKSSNKKNDTSCDQSSSSEFEQLRSSKVSAKSSSVLSSNAINSLFNSSVVTEILVQVLDVKMTADEVDNVKIRNGPH